MLSKVAGELYGTEKNINPVIVRVPYTNGKMSVAARYLRGIQLTLEDVLKKPGIKNPVVPMSISFPRQKLEKQMDADAWMSEFKAILQRLAQSRAILITGSGNEEGWQPDGSDPAVSLYSVKSCCKFSVLTI